MKFNDYLKELRESKHFTKKDLAAKLGLSGQYFVEIESGRSKPPTIKRCIEIAKILKLSEEEKNRLISLAAKERAPDETRTISTPGVDIVREPEDEIYRVQVVSRALAGSSRDIVDFEPIDDEEEFIEFKGCKAVEVISDSMAPIVYRGQKIIYSENESPKDGDLVFIKLKSGEQLFKRYHHNHKANRIMLSSVNPVQWEEPIAVDTSNVEWCYRVIGVKF